MLLTVSAHAQYGNEWIRFNQQYFKIPVANDGLYRLSYADLQAAGFPVSSDARRIQLFHRGTEQAIKVQKANAGVQALEPGDYLEFYGEKNKGDSDVELYNPTSKQPHPYYNLYNDTTWYYLTFNPLAVLGKRMEETTEINVSGIPAESYHTDEKLLVLASQYNMGELSNDYIRYSFFETGEGWTGAELRTGEFADYTLTGLTNGSQANGLPQLEVMVVGRAQLSHQVQIAVGPASPTRVAGSGFFSDFDTYKITTPLAWSDIGADGKIIVRVTALGVVGGSDRLSASYIRITYPQAFNGGGATAKFFNLRENASAKSYIEITNAPAGSRLYDVTDRDNVRLLRTTTTATLNAVVPDTDAARKLLMASAPLVPTIRKTSFRNIIPADHNYIIISHPLLMRPGGEYTNPVKAYGAYRASQAGGGYDTLILPIQQVYEQFNYGEVSPLAIRRFMTFMVNEGDPKFLFLIGKGLDVAYAYHRYPSEYPAFKDLVPSYGSPPSDQYYTVGLNGTTIEPAVATGRLSVMAPGEVAAYLNKVKETEALPYNDLWRKNLLHLSGGINAGEPALFKTYVEEFGSRAKDFYLGGYITAIAKGNTNIEFVNISDKVNSGVNLVTLFGHSAPDANDFNIGFVSSAELGYNNAGKYPMFLINGCNAGDFFSPAWRYGEDWVNAAGKGAVGFMANTSFGFTDVLRAYSTNFYNTAYGDSVFIHKGIGEIQKEVGRRFRQNGLITKRFVTQLHQMLLLGDPAMKLFGASKPDFEINAASIYEESFDAEPITALSDSFAIKIPVRNFGRAKEDNLAVRVTRIVSDNTSVVYDSIFPTVLYKDTLSFTIYRDREKGFGNNRFIISLDPDHLIPELNENNNTAEFSLFIPLNASRNLFPQDFSIVSTRNTNLVVQSTDVMGQARTFIVQLDTTDTFDSNFLQEFQVTGVLPSQAVTLLARDTTAYYWRSRFAVPQGGESADWTTASFTYINNGPEGWAQVHFPQYLADEAAGLIQDREARQLFLKETITDVSIFTMGGDNATPYTNVSVKLNGAEYNPQSLGMSCRDNTINIIAFSKTTTVPYVSIPVQFPDPRACGRRPEIIASFLSTEVESGDGKNLVQYITNVPAGDSVVLFSIGDAGYSSWSATVRSKLGEIGLSVTQLTALVNGEPVVIFGRKGAPAGTAKIVKAATAPASQQTLQVNGTVTGRFTAGTMTSPLIGPAQSWQQAILRADVSEVPVTDEFGWDIWGVSLTGERTLLFESVVGTTLLDQVDAATYPLIQITYHAADPVNLTAPQLNKWLVFYTPVAEGVLTFNSPATTQHVYEGQVWEGSYSFTNISTKSFSDSLVVRYEMFNRAFRGAAAKIRKIKSPAPGAKTDFTLRVATQGNAGINDLDVFVNPRIEPELYYDNNILQLNDYIQVEADNTSPALTVTIDGRRVVNGDYVSRNPVIDIRVWDDNVFLLRKDTLGVQIYLQYPCESAPCPFKPVYFNQPDITWEPATTSSDFVVHFTPQQLADGNYTLQVSAQDVTGNTTGADPYLVSFVVQSGETMVLQHPHPNPTAQAVYFSAIITGDDIPDGASVQIVSTTGRIVWEYYTTNVIVGTNEWLWNGADASGTDVSSGLYLYRVRLYQRNKTVREQTGRLAVTR